MTEETWSDVPGTGGTIQQSSEGRVRRVTVKVFRGECPEQGSVTLKINHTPGTSRQEVETDAC